MRYLEEAGYDLTIFLYSATRYPKVSVAGITQMLAGNAGYPQLDATFEIYDPATGVVGDFDAVVASDWPTAYAAWRYERNVPRIYWVQDFEPFFFPQSPDYVVAENSYRLGLHGIAVGPWLANKLRRDYDMVCDSYEFTADSSRYQRTNDEKRNEIMFYARPSTGRRGTEFGLLVLEELHRRRPDITINIAGWDMSKAGLTFPFVNHGTLSVADLPPLYNRCAAILTISLTCASLIPFESMACGTIPVVNDGENTRESLRDDARMDFVPLSVGAMVDALIDAVDRPDQVAHSRALAESMVGSSWSEAGDAVVNVFNKQLKLKKRG
jgi:glycosyltransferase involved in cell wall biosynthesis